MLDYHRNNIVNAHNRSMVIFLIIAIAFSSFDTIS